MTERTELLTLSEFARRVGVTVGRVSQLVKAKRFPITPEKKIIWPAARDIWRADHAMLTPQRTVPQMQGEDTPAGSVAALVDQSEQTADSKQRKELARARLLEAELAELRGHLVRVDDVKAEVRRLCASIRASLISLPGRAGLICENKSASEVEVVLSDLVNEVLTDWNQGRWAKP